MKAKMLPDFFGASMREPVNIGRLVIREKGPFFLIAGPCVVESEDMTLAIADFLRETGELLGIPVIFKASYDKANRTSVDTYRGPGIDKGLEILSKVKEKTGLPLLSDVHSVQEIEKASSVLDMIQIPALFLSANGSTPCRRQNRTGRQYQERSISCSLGHQGGSRQGPLDRQSSHSPYGTRDLFRLQQPDRRHPLYCGDEDLRLSCCL